MGQPVFRFKQFTIQQDRCGMKVSTDGILLGAWAPVETAGSILDIGTGSGLLALMAAQRNTQAEIHAIEIDLESAKQADEKFSFQSMGTSDLLLYPHAIQNFFRTLICMT